MEDVNQETIDGLNKVVAEARERGFEGALSTTDYADWANDFERADMSDLAARVRELCDW